MYAQIYTLIDICVRIYTYMHTNIHLYVNIFIHIYMCAHICKDIYVYSWEDLVLRLGKTSILSQWNSVEIGNK